MYLIIDKCKLDKHKDSEQVNIYMYMYRQSVKSHDEFLFKVVPPNAVGNYRSMSDVSVLWL